MERVLPSVCPPQVRIQDVPFGHLRTEGPTWVAPDEKAIYFMTEDPDFLKTPSIEITLFSLLGRVCLGQLTQRDGMVLSREEKGLRFLEEGFAQYLQTRDEAAVLGGRPEASRNFLDFVARIELLHGFVPSDFWKRFPDRREVADGSVPLHARRLEAQFVAGAFVRDLIEVQGLGMDGYLALWRRFAVAPLKPDATGRLLSEATTAPMIGAVLNAVTAGRIPTLEDAWRAFVQRVMERQLNRPQVTLEAQGQAIRISFSRAMLNEPIDVTLDNIQIAPERLTEIGAWQDDHTLVIDLPSVREQLGMESISTVLINYGRIWQWFRGRDGVPSEGARLALSAPPPAVVP